MLLGRISKQLHRQWRGVDRTFKVVILTEIRDLWVTLVQKREGNTRNEKFCLTQGKGEWEVLRVRREILGSTFWIPRRQRLKGCILEIGRKEFHTLVKSSVLESARLGFKRGLTKHLGDV